MGIALRSVDRAVIEEKYHALFRAKTKLMDKVDKAEQIVEEEDYVILILAE